MGGGNGCNDGDEWAKMNRRKKVLHKHNRGLNVHKKEGTMTRRKQTTDMQCLNQDPNSRDLYSNGAPTYLLLRFRFSTSQGRVIQSFSSMRPQPRQRIPPRHSRKPSGPTPGVTPFLISFSALGLADSTGLVLRPASYQQ